MDNKQEYREYVGRALVDFTEWVRQVGKLEELNTASMSANESDEQIKNSVKEYLERTKRRGIKR